MAGAAAGAGTKGSVQIGLALSKDTSLEAFAAHLRSHDVEVGGIIASEEAYSRFSFAEIPTATQSMSAIGIRTLTPLPGSS